MEDVKKDKKKIFKVLGLIISIVLVITLGTYAWLTWSSTDNTELTMTIGELAEIKFITGNDITTTNLAPVLDYNDGKSTTFSIKSRTDTTFESDVILNVTSIDSALQVDSFKYVILESSDNNTFNIINEGTFKNISTGINVIHALPIEPRTLKYYKFIIYIDGNMENDVNMMGKSISGTLSVEASYIEPNAPKLTDGLIPVTYDESKSSWVKADSTNTDNSWYDYVNKKWANAVLVRDKTYASSLSESSKSVSIDNTPVSFYTSSNQGKNSTTSTSTFTFTTGSTAGNLSFDYSVSSESNYDKLTIKVNDTTVVNAISGEYSSTYTLALTVNTEYVITASYSKDSSSASGDDQATISNIVLPSGSSSIVVAASGDYGWTEGSVYPLITYSSYTMLDNGTYMLSDGSKVSSTDAIDKYICSDTTSTECNQIYQIKTNSSDTITSVDVYTANPDTTGIRNAYTSSSNGTVIAENDILAYYVWIPRYKYRVWNITKTVGTDSYDAYHTGIDILFESGTTSTGTITCNYDFTITDGSLSEICSGTNNEYYTHPAFTFGDTEVEGIWVGKFEVSSSNPTANYGGGISTTLTVRTKPNVTSWRDNPLSNFSYVIQNMQITDNEYGLTTDKTLADSHMMKNMEWGAVAYLTNSNYGRCSNGTCTEIAINSYNSFKTGCGPQSAGSTSSGSTCNAYTTALGQAASTTGNIYGIYDMSGGAWEYVMGNTSRGSGSYTYYTQNAGSNFIYSTETAKYLDTYAYGTSNADQTAYNRARLGDATGENVLSTSSSGGWYSDYLRFVNSSSYWFSRGGFYVDGPGAGAFSFGSYNGNAHSYGGARCVVVLP